jgi:hypothetical protein
VISGIEDDFIGLQRPHPSVRGVHYHPQVIPMHLQRKNPPLYVYKNYGVLYPACGLPTHMSGKMTTNPQTKPIFASSKFLIM